VDSWRGRRMDLETVDCPVCGSAAADVVLVGRDFNTLYPGEFPLLRCRDCRMGYVSPRPTAAGIARYYPDHYWGPPPPEGVRPYIDRGTRAGIAAIVREHPGGRVLDVGCGVGKVVAFMRDRGLDAEGLEPYPHACRIARERYGIVCTCAFLQDAPLPEGSFDAVTFLDVMEHVDDPLGNLRAAYRLLRPGGLVCVKVPNFGALQARVLGRYWYWLDVPRHLLHFSPAPMERALREAGFAHVRARALPDWQGAMVFGTSLTYWLRDVHFRRRRLEVVPEAGQTTSDALVGKVYPGVPSAGKRAFRWLARNVAYVPFAFENLIGRSVELLATATK